MKWWVTAALTAMIYAGVTYALVETRGGDVSLFVVAGGPGVDPGKVPPGLTVTPETGYDGVAFYRLALDPFTSKKTDFGIGLDNPPYRQQRIGYPLIVWLLSGGGKPRLIPWLLLAVNFAGLVVIGGAGGALAETFGRSPLWGLLFPLYPGFLMTLSRDTSEIVAWAFALAAILAMARRHNLAAAILLTCAILTRETTITILAGAILVECGRLVRTRGRDVRAPLVIPVLVYLAWQLFLAHRWGTMPLIAGAPPLTRPFAEYIALIRANAPRRIQLQRIYFAEGMYLAAIVTTACVALRKSAAPLAVKIAFVAEVALASMLTHDVWAEHFGFMRIFSNLGTLGAAVVTGSNYAAVRWIALIATAGMWYYLALHVVALR